MHAKYSINGMRFHGFHGSLEVERELGLVFMVDVALHYQLAPGDDDPMTPGKVNGGDIYETTKNVMMGTKYRSHVSLAMRIAHDLFAKFAIVDEIEISIKRSHFFIPGDVDAIEADVRCVRGDFPELAKDEKGAKKKK